MLGLFESLNIGPNKTFEPDKLDPATAAGLRRAVEIGPQMLAADFTARLGQVINGWQITTDLGSWRTPDTGQLDFLLRSAIAKEAQPGQNPAEAIYPIAFSTRDGEPLTGDQPVRVAIRQPASCRRSTRSGRSRSTTRTDSRSTTRSIEPRSAPTTNCSPPRTARWRSMSSTTPLGRAARATGSPHPTAPSTSRFGSTTPGPPR